jgi:hypothetical protein
MSTGPLPENLPEELEALKRKLILMGAHDLPAAETEALAAQIGAIRLQLKRLRFDQAALSDELYRQAIDG